MAKILTYPCEYKTIMVKEAPLATSTGLRSANNHTKNQKQIGKNTHVYQKLYVGCSSEIVCSISFTYDKTVFIVYIFSNS